MTRVRPRNEWIDGRPPLVQNVMVMKSPTPQSAKVKLIKVFDRWEKKFGLTPSEVDAAWHAVRGLSNKEIAFQVGVSVATVRVQLASVYRKLSVGSRNELSYEAFCEAERI